MTPLQRAEHRRELLLLCRCPGCAESAPAGAILRGQACARCGTPLLLDGEADHAARMVEAVREDWSRWRVLVYGVVGVGSLLAGFVPLGGVWMSMFAMFVGHVMLLRRPLRWLPPARRVITRLSMKLWFAFLGVASFVLNLLAAPLLAVAGAGALFSALFGVGALALYLEGGLLLVERRIAREAANPRLTLLEWAIPLGLVGGLVVASVGGVILSWGMLSAIAALDVPGVATIARWLLEVR